MFTLVISVLQNVRVIGLLFALLLFAAVLHADTLEVGAGAPYSSIQAAVDDAVAGDTILLLPGTYIENVEVTLPLTLTSSEGAESTFWSTPVEWDTILEITADSVEVSGISFYGCPYGTAVIYSGVNGGWIHHCVAGWSPTHYNNTGIHVGQSSVGVLIENNTCNYNENAGIWIHGSSHTVIRNNICSYNTSDIYETAFGIGVHGTTNTVVHGNTLCYNDYGMYYSYNSSFEDFCANTCDYNRYGLHGYFMSRINISGNSFEHNSEAGVYLSSYGLSRFNHNSIQHNTGYGVELYNCNNFYAFQNTIADNLVNLHPTSGANQHWYSPVRLGMSYEGIDSKSFPGNYFDSYSGTDADGDGFGDTPFVQDVIQDPNPLMATPEQYCSAVWYLGMGNTMYHNDPRINGGLLRLEAGESHLWIADECATEEIAFPAGSALDSTAWTGVLNYEYNDHPTVLLEVGVWDGSTFTPGPAVTLTGYANYWTHAYTTSAEVLSVPVGQYLALRLTSQESTRYFDFHMGGSWAFLSAPAGATYPGSSGSTSVLLSASFNAGSGCFTLEWNAVAGADSYNVYYADAAYGPFVLLDTVAIPGYTDCSPGITSRFYRVTAVLD